MKFGYSEVCLEHDTGDRHPEIPDRLRAIREGLKREYGVRYVDPDPADRSAVEAVHDPDYVAEFREFCEDGGGNWDPDTVAVERTWDAALKSAGIAQWAAEAALAGADGRETPFSIGRPPGHHAVTDDAMGFCFVNNVAVAAQTALDKYDEVDRVGVVDWDVHHGNGTQEIFYDRDDVYFVSTHEEGIYPGTGEVGETGEGDGSGHTLNAPLPAGSGDAEFAAVFDDVIAPAVAEYDPDLLLVSAGFDAHRHDPISRLRVSTEGYGVLTDRVRRMADETDAPLAFVLEGGYGLDVLAEGVRMVHEVFDGREPMETDDGVDEDVEERVEELRETHGLGEK
jgi:acetoin utilization deacetylase AcuC-like enzyme